ncbi:hypothetical protein [Propionivibrio limicola]|uniref:hypothetical protein n=1 Tax=Propionivibrio limicola TaxID=167645 RepID=UPI00129124EF|nr:hypothetical protein [Propionivibrio limicola]
MKSTIATIVLLLVGLASSHNAEADHRAHRHYSGYRGSVGITFGPYWGPYWDPWYYPPRYYYPPAVIERPYPQVYIEQAPADSASPSSEATGQDATANYWYFCRSAKAYYPYVRECPGGWERVLPQPPR